MNAAGFPDRCLLPKLGLALIFGLATSFAAEGSEDCGLPADSCYDAGRSEFERYQKQKLSEIARKSSNYRLPSQPIALFHPQRTEYSVLLIHGLNDSPFFMGDLADLLYRAGYNVLTILLPGHGTNTQEIRHIRAEQWLDEVAIGLKMAGLVGRKVVIGGFSLGGALALDAALRESRIRGILLFAPALRLPYFDSLYALSCVPALGGVSINSKMGINPVKYKYRLLNGVCQVYRLLNNRLDPEHSSAGLGLQKLDTLKEAAARIRIPTFGCMTFSDQRVSSAAILEFFGALNAPALLTTFGREPEDQTLKFENGGEVVHSSDQGLPHSYLVRRTNSYNGQANPHFDRLARILLGFLKRNFD